MQRSRKNINSIDRKLGLIDVELKKITAEKKSDVDGMVKLKRESKHKIVEVTEKEVIIGLFDSIQFEPASPFIIETYVEVRYRVKEPVNEEEIKSNVQELISPCGGVLSLITSFVTDKMLGAPVVIPPIIEWEKEKSKSKK